MIRMMTKVLKRREVVATRRAAMMKVYAEANPETIESVEVRRGVLLPRIDSSCMCF